MPSSTGRVLRRWIVAAGIVAAGCAGGEATPPAPSAGIEVPPAPWVSRAVPEARGDVVAGADGRRQAVRYRGWSTEDFARFRTYAYGDTRPEPARGRAAMPGPGDAAKGRRLFLDRNLGPCTGCHLVQGADVWPAGSVGPDLSAYGDRGLADRYVFDMIYDPRHVFPQSVMPPWGTDGVLTPAEIADVVAFLKTQRSPLPAETNPERNPATRPRPTGFGDNLDPTNNPAVVRAEDAAEAWARRGPAEKACADCHAGAPATAMKGVATRYPRYVASYARVMSIEDFLAAHGPETTGTPLPSESAANLDLTLLVKMASNDLPVALDLASPQNAAALERGRRSFYRRVGQRNHACADCHTTEGGKGADRFLGGRLLADVAAGLTRHFPTWRTSQADVWDMRKRIQWCMTPLGANMLAADAVEYAELELYLTSFDVGKPLSVPGIRH
jgi:L-cysteine S-thiosulfotransferase